MNKSDAQKERVWNICFIVHTMLILKGTEKKTGRVYLLSTYCTFFISQNVCVGSDKLCGYITAHGALSLEGHLQVLHQRTGVCEVWC